MRWLIFTLVKIGVSVVFSLNVEEGFIGDAGLFSWCELSENSLETCMPEVG